MPGTLTRLAPARNRTSGRRLRLASRDGLTIEPLARCHVAVFGADSNPHFTGFPQFTSTLLNLLAQRSRQVSQPLLESLGAAPDLVVAVLPGPGPAAAAVELASRCDVALLVIVEAETAAPIEDADVSGARLAARLEGTALRRANRWAVTGEAARSRLHRLGVEDARIDTLAYWLPSALESPSARPPTPVSDVSRRTARQLLGWPDGLRVVCPVGADTSGLSAVLAAAEDLGSRATNDVQVTLVGSGPRLRALRSSVRTSVNVSVAEVADQQYVTAFLAADLVVLSESSYRPDAAMSGRMATALAAGRPVIAAVDAEGHLSAELARATGATICVPTDCPSKLADAIDILSGAPQARAWMSAAARRYTTEFLSPAVAGDTLEAIVTRTFTPNTGQPGRRER